MMGNGLSHFIRSFEIFYEWLTLKEERFVLLCELERNETDVLFFWRIKRDKKEQSMQSIKHMWVASITVKAAMIIKTAHCLPLLCFSQLGSMAAKLFTFFPSDWTNIWQIHNPITGVSYFMSDYLTIYYLYSVMSFIFTEKKIL